MGNQPTLMQPYPMSYNQYPAPIQQVATSTISHTTTTSPNANECALPNAKPTTPIAPRPKSYKTNLVTNTTYS